MHYDHDEGAQPPVSVTPRRILSASYPGAIYLLHASSHSNVNALAKAIHGLEARGYQFATPDALRSPDARFRARNTQGAMKVTATDEVRELVREQGGRLYVWTSVHGCCTGKLTLLEAGTVRPPTAGRRFRESDAGGFELLLDLGGQRQPEELVLELRGRRKKIAAFWNDQVWVG